MRKRHISYNPFLLPQSTNLKSLKLKSFEQFIRYMFTLVVFEWHVTVVMLAMVWGDGTLVRTVTRNLYVTLLALFLLVCFIFVICLKRIMQCTYNTWDILYFLILTINGCRIQQFTIYRYLWLYFEFMFRLLWSPTTKKIKFISKTIEIDKIHKIHLISNYFNRKRVCQVKLNLPLSSKWSLSLLAYRDTSTFLSLPL